MTRLPGSRYTALVVLLALATLGACDDTRGHAEDAARIARGKALLAAYGCTACHSIKGMAITGSAGPPLEHIADNSYIAGILPNNAAAMERWIVAPRRISPGTAMPDLGVKPDEARAMAAYLYEQ
jgi:cytochrome c